MPDHLHLDTSDGVTAEALLAAMVDLGVPLERLERTLENLPGGICLRVSSPRAGGTAIAVEAPHHATIPAAEARAHLDVAGLAPEIRERARKALHLLSGATRPEEPLTAEQFGLIVAVSAAVETLGAKTISASPLPLPRTEDSLVHGTILTLLSGAVVRVAELPPEAVTPLGLALARSLAEPAVLAPEFELSSHGSGGNISGRPLVWVLAGRLATADVENEKLVLLETNLDDLHPELLATLIPTCLAAGAVDAWLTPVLMKKGRPAQVLSALCSPGSWPTVEQVMFRESSTLGVRRTKVTRTSLPRRTVQVETPWGSVAVKIGFSDLDAVNRAPEFEDCLRLATAAGVPVKTVYAAALGAAEGAWPGAGED